MKKCIGNTYMAFSSVLCPLEIMESSKERPLRGLGVCSGTEKQVQSSTCMSPVRGGQPVPAHLNQRDAFSYKKRVV